MRAVASACASNPVALAIPCHRVVDKDGALAGYRWGMPRKAALLDNEAQHAGDFSGGQAERNRRADATLTSISKPPPNWTTPRDTL